MISLKTAEKFHGHLGPWLVLGLLMGKYAIKKIGAKKYFGLDVKVSGLNKKPRSCLIDGLQLSTGATLGKGNICLNGSRAIKVNFKNRGNHKKICLGIKKDLLKKLNNKMTHKEAEKIAREIFRINPAILFELI